MFKGELFNFQKTGAQALFDNNSFLLGDSVGLGKTVMTIKALCDLKEQLGYSKYLILTPNPLLKQWGKEIEKFSDEQYQIINGNSNERYEMWENPKTFNITNIEKLYGVDFNRMQWTSIWDAVVIDEITRIKNSKAIATKRLQEIKAKRKYGLSGAPLENSPLDLYGIFSFLKPLYFGKYWDFRKRYVVQKFVRYPNGTRFNQIMGYKNLDELRAKIQPFMLRRTKQEVEIELPELLEENIYVDITKEQKEIYSELKKQAVQKLKERQSAIGLYAQMKVIASSVEAYNLGASGTRGGQYDNKKNNPKLNEMFELLKSVFAQNQKAIVFTQYKRVLEIIVRELENNDVHTAEIKGGQTEPERNEQIRKFKTNAHIKVLVSTDAGAYGLNLQNASYVINFDHLWNPKRLEQRSGRAHRIGQKRNVTVINLWANDTIDERIIQVLKTKKDLFDKIVEKKEDVVLGNEEMIKMLEA